VSPGCDNCYAKALAHRFWGERPFEEVHCLEDRLSIPLRWRDPRTIFVNSMSDLFHKDVPDDFIDRVLAVTAIETRHRFLMLTKRAERMARYFDRIGNRYEDLEKAIRRVDPSKSDEEAERLRVRSLGPFGFFPNVELGVSVEAPSAAWRINALREIPAAVRFISAEPLLDSLSVNLGGLNWVIVGGESGPHHRPMDLRWLEEIASQCDVRGIPLFVKQDSGPRPGQQGRIPDALWARKEFPRERP
jgi:protein gp37